LLVRHRAQVESDEVVFDATENTGGIEAQAARQV
jgi:hypothetical protein